jgi:hypothetical protein
MRTHRCSWCERYLPASAFFADRSRSNSYQSRCKDCNRLRMKAHSRALNELRQRYPNVYARLMEAHIAALLKESS